MRSFSAAVFCIVCLLVSLIAAPNAGAAGNLTSFASAEKDLFHFYATSPNPATPCKTFTSADLPKTSRFDTTTGLFSWLYDYGSFAVLQALSLQSIRAHCRSQYMID